MIHSHSLQAGEEGDGEKREGEGEEREKMRI